MLEEEERLVRILTPRKSAYVYLLDSNYVIENFENLIIAFL
jgi:hypothetical protein